MKASKTKVDRKGARDKMTLTVGSWLLRVKEATDQNRLLFVSSV